jgi:DNA-binding winged helix-turn-helix (wHTH) protein
MASSVPIATVAFADRFGRAPVRGSDDGDSVIRFRRFSVHLGARLVLCDGRSVELGSRGFDLLVVLLKARGAVVSKNEIMHYVWPSMIVDDGNLRFQMAALRKALGKDRDLIKTVTGRGYLFATEVATGPAEPLPLEPSTRKAAPRALSGARRAREQAQPAVVVIDDDRGMSETLRGLLRSAGLSVAVFASVQDYLDGTRLVPIAAARSS